MIIDARRIETSSSLEADLCIVGAGAAGITLALQLMRSGLRVIMLESGGTRPDARIQALSQGEVADAAVHSAPDRYRQRILGGSTTIWGGRCVPFDAIDFTYRNWIPESGWPISYSALKTYYPAATALCEAGSCHYDADQAVPGGMRPLIRGFAPWNFTTERIERFSRPTDFGRRWSGRLSAAPNLQLLLHANCVRICRSRDGTRISHIDVRTLDGGCFTVTARQFVLAAGALETTRLLLASATDHTSAIGNDYDLLGRFYMCHIAGTIGNLRIHRPVQDVWHGYERSEDGVYCRRRFALTEAAQQRSAIGNIIFRLHHPRVTDASHRTGILSAIYLGKRLIPYEYAKRLGEEPVTGRERLAHLGNILRDGPGTAKFLLHWLRFRHFAERRFPSIIVRPRTNIFSLEFNAEQVPNPDSRVLLSTQLDPLGVPKVRIDWRYSPLDVRTVELGFRMLQDDFARSGAGDLTLPPQERDIDWVVRRDGALGGHHIGTARMGDSPKTGVVDSSCRVFGMTNLYVASSAVFPTSSQANPTLTIVALSLRLAEHLKRNLGQATALDRVQSPPRRRTVIDRYAPDIAARARQDLA